MNVPTTLFKSTVLATGLFWALLFTEEFSFSLLPIALLLMIPIFICVALATLFTICPFFWFESGSLTTQQIFKKHFPLYAIVSFIVCSYFSYLNNFDLPFLSFSSTAYFTSLQTWIWFIKEYKHD